MTMNWAEEYAGKKKDLPDFLTPLCLTSKISPDMKLKIPSGQWYNELSSKQRKQWRELVEYLGEDPERYLEQMRARTAGFTKPDERPGAWRKG
jgi:hypothetical protein